MKIPLRRFILTFFAAAALFTVFIFQAGAVMSGDIDQNGEVSSDDARLCLRFSVHLDEPTQTQADIADVDMDLEITADDARTILRRSVGLEQAAPYYAAYLIKEPTCTVPGEYKRVCTETQPGIGGAEFIQETPPLGHDFSAAGEVAEPATCTEDGKEICKCSRCEETETRVIPAGHSWLPSTCTEPSKCEKCGVTMGEVPGHTTKIGHCAVCGEYISELLPVYKEQMMPALNNGVKYLNRAFFLFSETSGVDIYEDPDAAAEIKLQYTYAYSYYYKAYTICGDHADFAQVKEHLYNICLLLLDIMNCGEITEENYSGIAAMIIENTLAITDEDGYNLAIKHITDTWKESYIPPEDPATPTDAEKATPTDAERATPTDA